MSTLPIVNLRAMEPEDLDMLYHLENDRLLWDIGTTNVPYSRYVLHDYIAHSSGDIYTDKEVRLIIEDGQRQTVGIVDITSFDPKNLRAEVGIVIAAPYRRQGYARAALNAIHDYACSTLHLHQLYAIISSGNEASLALFTQMGYTISGLLSDWLLLADGYQPAVIMQRVF